MRSIGRISLRTLRSAATLPAAASLAALQSVNANQSPASRTLARNGGSGANRQREATGLDGASKDADDLDSLLRASSDTCRAPAVKVKVVSMMICFTDNDDITTKGRCAAIDLLHVNLTVTVQGAFSTQRCLVCRTPRSGLLSLLRLRRPCVLPGQRSMPRTVTRTLAGQPASCTLRPSTPRTDSSRILASSMPRRMPRCVLPLLCSPCRQLQAPRLEESALKDATARASA